MQITDTSNWTFGCEFELSDLEMTRLPMGFDRSLDEQSVVNSNGIACDKTLLLYRFGGEVLTRPSDSPESQAEELCKLLKFHPNAKTNYRTGFHGHIRVPGLRDNLLALKQLAKYNLENSNVLQLIDPLPKPNLDQHKGHIREAQRRYEWMMGQHQTVTLPQKVEWQLRASSTREFFDAGCMRHTKEGVPCWQWHTRPAVNIGRMRIAEENTIEFRHFPGTINPQEVITSLNWCRDYLLAAFDGVPAVQLFNVKYANARFPTLDNIYVHWMEERWKATTSKHNKPSVIAANINKFLKEDKCPLR